MLLHLQETSTHLHLSAVFLPEYELKLRFVVAPALMCGQVTRIRGEWVFIDAVLNVEVVVGALDVAHQVALERVLLSIDPKL